MDQNAFCFVNNLYIFGGGGCMLIAVFILFLTLIVKTLIRFNLMGSF